jgi:hypothetical protein
MSNIMVLKNRQSPSPEGVVINISTSRISGVAPLSVFFDATGTTGIADTEFFEPDSGSVNGSYMDATFHWNFDFTNVDTEANYRTGSGFVAAHVFENPGNYTVRLDVYDNTGYIGFKTVAIQVTEFSGTTYYVADDGHDTNNDGLSTTAPFLTVAKGLSMLGTNVRVLFKNGDTFTITAQVTVSTKTGPAIVGAYSDPADPSTDEPIIHITAEDTSYTTIYFSACSDIRIMNLEQSALGESSTDPRHPSGFSFDNSSRNMLKYRTVEHDNGGMSMSPSGQYNVVQECEYYNTTQTGYTSPTNDYNALIGNYVHHKNTVDTHNKEHIFRMQGGSNYYIAHNIFGPDILVDYDALTIRGNSYNVVIYKNILTGWIQAAWPQNRNSANEYQHHVIFDSNLIKGQGTYALDRERCIALHSKDIVIRNNIIYDYQYGVTINNDTVVGASTRIKVYNNTFIYPRGADNFYVIDLDYRCSNIFIKNNIMLDLDSTSRTFLNVKNGELTVAPISDYNIMYGAAWSNQILFDGSTLAEWQAATDNDDNSAIQNPNLISTDPVNANFAKLTISIAGEVLNYNALDFSGILRGQIHDAGAVEA